MQEVTNEEMQREQNKTRIYKEKYQRILIYNQKETGFHILTGVYAMPAPYPLERHTLVNDSMTVS